MSGITKPVRDIIRVRLADSATGFNPRLVAAMATAGFTPPPGFRLPVDFANTGRNFFQADILPADIDATTASTYPAATLFAIRSRNLNLEKFALFAGSIEMGFNLFASWMQSKLIPDFETFGDCVEEAIYGSFNDPALLDWATPTAVYNGDVAVDRSKLLQGEKNWIQMYSSRLTFEAHVVS